MTHSTLAIIGDGAMGTVCALMLAENGHDVCLWSAFPEAARELAQTRENRRFLPGHALDSRIRIARSDAEPFDGVEMVFSAVPTQFMRGVWQRLAAHCPAGLSVCSVTKGIENATLLRPTQILCDVLDAGRDGRALAALSGPSIAPEVARGLPASVAVAASDDALADRVQALLNRPYFRIYTNSDLVGLEIAGAAKNVIAIAAGILDGLHAGDNAKAALVTRGLAEIARLGQSAGGRAETFFGLAGVGDLITTCTSPIGRNRCFGQAVGQGATAEQAQAQAHGVVEGVATTVSLVQLARRLGVEMPITQAVHDILFEHRPPDQAIAQLMARPLKAE